MHSNHRTFGALFLAALAWLFVGTGPSSAGDSPWFIGAKLGQADGEARFGSRHPKWIDDDSATGAVEIGYSVNRHLAVQAGFHDFGSHRGFGSPCRQTDEVCIERLATLGLCAEGFECVEVLLGMEADISGFSLALVPSWPFGERLSVLGKVGLMSWDSDVAGLDGLGAIESFSGEDLLAGIGLRYDLAGGLGLMLEYEQVDLDVSSTSVGMRWRF